MASDWGSKLSNHPVIVVVGLLASLLGILAFATGKGSLSDFSPQQSVPAVEDAAERKPGAGSSGEETVSKDSWRQVELNAPRDFVEAKMGPPRLRERDGGIARSVYVLPDYFLLVAYGPDDTVIQFSLTSRVESFKPSFFWPHLGEKVLGSFRFADLEFDMIPFAFDHSAKHWFYVEKLEGFGATRNRHIFVSDDGLGSDYCPVTDEGSAALLGISDTLYAVVEGDGAAEVVGRLPKFRSVVCPNSFGYLVPDYQLPAEASESTLMMPVIDRELQSKLF